MEVELIPATIADDDRMFQFLINQYHVDEPVNVASRRTLPADKEDSALIAMLKYNLSILAIKKDDHSFICGFVLIKEVKANGSGDGRAQVIADHTDAGYRRMLQLLDFAEKRLHEEMKEYWERTKVDSVLDLTIICVHRDFRNQGIASKMMKRCLELAKEKGFKLVTIQCSSAYSTALAISNGFTLVYSLPFQDYKNENGEVVFDIKAPHTSFNCLVKEIM